MALRPALAQSKYPDRPIRLVIPFTTGGVNDAVGRPWADKMKSLLGTVVVENVGGAGGGIGAAMVARAKSDGYTILLGGMGSQVIVGVATNRANYDPINDFDPIALLGVTALTIAVHPSVPAKTLLELIDYAKANRGKLSFGSSGAGAMTHLTGELFKSLAGLPDIVHVPYRGGGPLISDLISGHIPMIAQSVTGHMMELHETGKVRMLCVTSPNRLVAFPSLPTAVEAGLPGMIAQNFIGLFAPVRTPKEIIEQIARSTRTAMADQQFQQTFIASGFDPVLDSTPEKTRRFVDEEIVRWTPVIKAIGLKLDCGGVSCSGPDWRRWRLLPWPPMRRAARRNFRSVRSG
jgi:tripartite-type tricarboxylate transporter receptor subunit TctC